MDTASQPQSTPPVSSSNNSIMPMILLVLAVLIGLGAFMYYQNQNGKAQTNVTITNETQPDESTTMEQKAPEDAVVTSETTTDSTDAKMENDADTAAIKEFKVEGTPFKFDLATMSVKKGDTVRVVFTNAEGMHDWVIDEFNARTKVLQTGQTETIEFVANEAGEFEYYCSIGNHRAQGMVGTLTVTE